MTYQLRTKKIKLARRNVGEECYSQYGKGVQIFNTVEEQQKCAVCREKSDSEKRVF